jgi:mannose-6-phosphate isomerase-like protein (cupin superfamily)
MSNEFFALDQEGGDPLWYLQVLMTIKASGDKTGGALGLLDFKTPAGQTPLHVHHKEDEGWYLLEGRISCTCGDETVTAGPGSFLWLPRDIPHRLRFETECHLLQIAIPAGLEVFHKEMGQPAPRIELPPPGQVLDKEKYRRLAAEHGLEIIELPQWDASKDASKEEAKR